MKNIIYITCLLLVSATMAVSQTGPENFREGILLHRLELASSYADNHLKSNYKSIYKSGFLNFSFQNTNHNVITLIIDDFDNREVLVQYTFDSIPRSTPKEIKTGISPTTMEERIIDILEDATRKIKDQYEGNFQPSSTNFYTAIPIISKEENKVIVFSKPIKKTNEIVFGNDYELKYDSANNFISIKKLHEKSVSIPVNRSSGDVTYHEHQTSDEITSTDVCTILLNKNRIQWKQHIVLNPEYVAIFDVKNGRQLFMLREEFDDTIKKMNNEQ